MTSANFSRLLIPLLVCILGQFVGLHSRNPPYYISFWGTPPPTADIICTCPLAVFRNNTYVVACVIFLQKRFSSP